MSDEANATTGAPSSAPWIVTGVQTVTANNESARVDVVIRGKVEGVVDRGGGADQLRFSVWDDGQEMDFKVVNIPLGKTGVVTVRLGFDGRYAIVADGIGIAVVTGSEPGGERVFEMDPFFPEQQ